LIRVALHFGPKRQILVVIVTDHESHPLKTKTIRPLLKRSRYRPGVHIPRIRFRGASEWRRCIPQLAFQRSSDAKMRESGEVFNSDNSPA